MMTPSDSSHAANPSSKDEQHPPYNRAVMGGTFDRLHEAHESLLHTAAHMAREVFVGVVSEELGKDLFPKKKFHEMIEPYEIRRNNVYDYLSQYCEVPEVKPLYNPWGPAPTDTDADLIVVSFETEANGHRINDMRRENNLPELDMVIIPWIYRTGARISSTRLREEEALEKKRNT